MLFKFAVIEVMDVTLNLAYVIHETCDPVFVQSRKVFSEIMEKGISIKTLKGHRQSSNNYFALGTFSLYFQTCPVACMIYS